MRLLQVILPIAVMTIAASVPLIRYGWRDAQERVAIGALQQVVEAQRRIRASTGAFVTSPSSLTTPCESSAASLSGDVLQDLERAGYQLEVRATVNGTTGERDCHRHARASDYYAAVSPISAGSVARQAFAATADGQIYLFHDGIAPREADMAAGVATRLENRESFVIP